MRGISRLCCGEISKGKGIQMKRLLLFLCCIVLYMEVVYHVITQRSLSMNVILLIPIVLLVTSLESMLVCAVPTKAKKPVFYSMLGVEFIFYCAQLVYFGVFKQPLLFAAVNNAGAAALTNYWRETLVGILSNWYGILLFAMPVGLAVFLQKKKWLDVQKTDITSVFASVIWVTVSLSSYVVILNFGYYLKTDYYEEYQGYYDSLLLVENYGIAPVMTRSMLGDILPSNEEELFTDSMQSGAPIQTTEPANAEENLPQNVPVVDENVIVEEPKDENPYNVLSVDAEKLLAVSDTKAWTKLVNTFLSLEPTAKNDYTGLFEGYNLVYLTAEGFSPYAVSEELTPTLYKLIHSGVIAPNYYVPLWQTSTSDGEYVNLTGLIPDQQFSMKRTAENEQPFSLGAYFASEGAACYAFHNGTMSYYDRYLSHPNMGYDFYAATLGELTEEEYGDKIFPMEHPNYWPSSDLEMMQGTLPYYINEDRFHVYYMTVSGHLNYSFSGNRMSSLNKEAVAHLPYSSEARAYLACNLELDKALEYLLAQLEEAGKLDTTVIVLSADHYPYGMSIGAYEELAGRELEGTLDIYRNSLILWNSKMEDVVVDKPCCSVDILPTLLNLFGFDYDSRLYAGRDIFAEGEGLVIMSNRSFVTDTLEYDKKKKETTPKTEAGFTQEYFDERKAYVKKIYEYSGGIINQNFYHYVKEALIVE